MGAARRYPKSGNKNKDLDLDPSFNGCYYVVVRGTTVSGINFKTLSSTAWPALSL